MSFFTKQPKPVWHCNYCGCADGNGNVVYRWGKKGIYVCDTCIDKTFRAVCGSPVKESNT